MKKFTLPKWAVISEPNSGQRYVHVGNGEFITEPGRRNARVSPFWDGLVPLSEAPADDGCLPLIEIDNAPEFQDIFERSAEDGHIARQVVWSTGEPPRLNEDDH